MGDVNPPVQPAIPPRVRTLGEYSLPSHEGYRNAIELSEAADVSHLRSDTIRMVQNGCAFHGLRSEEPNQHLEEFLNFVDSIYLIGASREITHLRLFQLFVCDQASNWFDRLPTGSISA
ncbi:hypothetical protein Tco_1161008 [Tanacetum coccineum]